MHAKYKRAAIATDHGYCSEIGRNVLFHGGNSVEAAIASLLCIGVVNPQSSGLGGGFIMTIFNATTQRCLIVDARETAPSGTTEDMWVDYAILTLKWLQVCEWTTNFEQRLRVWLPFHRDSGRTTRLLHGIYEAWKWTHHVGIFVRASNRLGKKRVSCLLQFGNGSTKVGTQNPRRRRHAECVFRSTHQQTLWRGRHHETTEIGRNTQWIVQVAGPYQALLQRFEFIWQHDQLTVLRRNCSNDLRGNHWKGRSCDTGRLG